MNDEVETPLHGLDGLLTAAEADNHILPLLERIAELTGRLLQAEVALGSDGPITGDALPAAIAALVAERDRLRAVVDALREWQKAEGRAALVDTADEVDRHQEAARRLCGETLAKLAQLDGSEEATNG